MGASEGVGVGSSECSVTALLASCSVSAPTASSSARYQTGGEVDGSAALSTSGVVYIGSADGKVYALNADGSLKWSYSTGAESWYARLDRSDSHDSR